MHRSSRHPGLAGAAIRRVWRTTYSLGSPLAVAAIVTACDGPPERPSHLDPFRIAGPAEVAPGTSAPFKAILDRVATLTDVSQQAEWISSNRSVLSVDAGLATAHASGEVTVAARFEEQQTDPKLVIVVPPGTFRVRGTAVTQTATPLIPLFMARVDVPAVGLTTTTDGQGRYALYGVPQDAEIRLTKEGYAPATLTVHVVNHDQQFSTTLRPAIAGTYKLTIGGGQCSLGPPLPPELLQRTYTAVLTQAGVNGSQVQGTLTGANLTVVSFSGSFNPGQSRWNLGFTIGERLPDGKALTFNGGAFIRTSDLAGEFNGRIALNDPA